MRHVGKRLVLTAAGASGVSAAVGRTRWRTRRLLILGYHGISLADEHAWSPPLYMAPAVFRRRLALLREHRCTVLGLGDALSRLAAGTLPPRAVALTFDDGFHDFGACALPLLEEFDYPATVYLTTHYVGRDVPVFDVMGRYLLWLARDRVLPFDRVADAGDASVYRLTTADERATAWAAVQGAARAGGLDTAGKDVLAERLAGVLGIDYAALRDQRVLQLMTRPEVAACAARGVTFALHTHRHRTPMDRATFLGEVATNRREIEAMLPAELRSAAAVQHFCYPSCDHQPEFETWLAEAGVVSAVTCAPGLAAADTPRLALPRFVDGGQVRDASFEAWLTGTAALLPTAGRGG